MLAARKARTQTNRVCVFYMHSRQVKPEQLSSVQCRIVCPCWGKLLSALRLEMYPMLIKNVVEAVGLGLNDTNIIIHRN